MIIIKNPLHVYNIEISGSRTVVSFGEIHCDMDKEHLLSILHDNEYNIVKLSLEEIPNDKNLVNDPERVTKTYLSKVWTTESFNQDKTIFNKSIQYSFVGYGGLNGMLYSKELINGLEENTLYLFTLERYRGEE